MSSLKYHSLIDTLTHGWSARFNQAINQACFIGEHLHGEHLHGDLRISTGMMRCCGDDGRTLWCKQGTFPMASSAGLGETYMELMI